MEEGTTVPDPVGSYFYSFVKGEESAVSRERKEAQQYQTPWDHTLYLLVKAGEISSIKWPGGGTTIANPVGLYPLLTCPKRRMLQY